MDGGGFMWESNTLPVNQEKIVMGGGWSPSGGPHPGGFSFPIPLPIHY